MRRTRMTAALALVVLASAGSATVLAYPLDPGWRDAHYNYPRVPSGESQIRSVFGPPCGARVNDNSLQWRASDNGVTYTVRYHARLGGFESSNLPDVRGHIAQGGHDGTIRSGIWGYNCRRKRGGAQFSTHAWGIAVDINSAHEHFGHSHCHTVPTSVGSLWRNHNWTWGNAFRDCMHFQYATDY